MTAPLICDFMRREEEAPSLEVEGRARASSAKALSDSRPWQTYIILKFNVMMYSPSPNFQY